MPIFALLIWPFVTILIFRMLTLRSAVICALLSGYLFLPEAFALDLPGIPAIEKGLVIGLSLLMAVIIFGEQKGSAHRQGQTGVSSAVTADRLFQYLILGLLALLIANAILTIMTNREELRFGPTVLTSLRPWDIVSDLTKTLVWLLPFLIGRRFLNRPEDHRTLLKFLVIGGLVYSLFILIEIRFSPQLHNWVYGFHQHSFLQHVRGGNFRPKVFLTHGLSVGLFLFMTVIAACALWASSDKKDTAKWLAAAIFLFFLLFISRNLGAFVILLLLLPVFMLGRFLQLQIITVISILFLTFPALRQADLVPLDWVIEKAGMVNEDRAQSFEFRVGHEDALLARAADKPMSGWGGWGRSRIYDEYGRDISVTDGLWIIVLGTSGWLGYIAYFGILVAPLLFLRRAHKRKKIGVETMALGLIGTGVLIYLVPNSHIGPIGWLIAGAVAGFVQYDTTKVTATQEAEKPSRVRRSASYTRYPVQTQRGS